MPGSDATGEEADSKRRRRSLPEHLDRVCERVTARRAAMTAPPPAFDAVLEAVTQEAAAFRDMPGPIRGETRERVTARLVELDRMMLDAARAQADPADLRAMSAEAADELAPFRDRMPEETYRGAIESAIDRLVRDREQLPTVFFD
jgi:hypothetical protein